MHFLNAEHQITTWFVVWYSQVGILTAIFKEYMIVFGIMWNTIPNINQFCRLLKSYMSQIKEV